MTAHWGVEEPTQANATEEATRRKFLEVASILRRRIELFVSLPIEKLDRLALQKSLQEIGQSR